MDNLCTDLKQFGVVGDGVADDAPALQRALDETRGVFFLPPGDYRLTHGLKVRLDQRGHTAVRSAGARLLNQSPEPALHVIGTHTGSASPAELTDAVGAHELMPTVCDLEIVGGHGGDGIRLERTYKAVVSRVTVRDCVHGIHIPNHNRNIIIADCHLYRNYGIGVFLDNVNLHQINIHGCHIQYNYRGGIKIVEGNVRNVQIVGNDIEYNRNPDDASEPAGDVWFVAGPIGIREGAICGNTIQGVPTQDGANVRLEGISPQNMLKVGLLTVSGNLITSQQVNILCRYARGIALGDNIHISGHERNIRLEDCEQVTITGAVLDNNPDYRPAAPGGIELNRVQGCTVTGVMAENCREALSATACSGLSVTGCCFRNTQGRALNLMNCSDVAVTGCVFPDTAGNMTEALAQELCERVTTTGNVI
ncbi:right-handed parallel beta-helix repeat-containing protein [bacterium]|nr:right-handed parallel beta-helix repeat-containing protein [bacterium]